jgi:hypothetical protein
VIISWSLCRYVFAIDTKEDSGHFLTGNQGEDGGSSDDRVLEAFDVGAAYGDVVGVPQFGRRVRSRYQDAEGFFLGSVDAADVGELLVAGAGRVALLRAFGVEQLLETGVAGDPLRGCGGRGGSGL